MASTDKLWNTTGALRIGDCKILVGPQNQASWYGHFTPNSTKKPSIAFTACHGGVVGQPCLYNLAKDPTEHHDLSQSTAPEDMAAFVQLKAHVPPPPPPRPPTHTPHALAHFSYVCLCRLDVWMHWCALVPVPVRAQARFKALEKEYHPPPNPNRKPQMYCDHLASLGGWVAPWYTA